MAYYIEYMLNWRYRPGKSADIGTIAHAALEIVAQIKLAKQNRSRNAKTEIGKINVNKFDMNNIIDRTYAFYTSKPEYQNNVWTDKDLRDVRKYVNVVLTHNNEQFNPLKRNIISTEEYLKLEIKEPWAVLPNGDNFKVTGFIDLVTQIDENSYEIIDYKTGKLNDFLTGQEINETFLRNDIQLRLYHLAVAEKFGCDKNYLLTMFFLKYSKPITIALSCDDIIETKEKIKKRFLEIFNTKIPKLNRTWKCTKFCNYGKNTFQDTSVLPIIQFMDNGIARSGQNCTICDQVNLEINRRGPNWVEDNMVNPK